MTPTDVLSSLSIVPMPIKQLPKHTLQKLSEMLRVAARQRDSFAYLRGWLARCTRAVEADGLGPLCSGRTQKRVHVP